MKAYFSKRHGDAIRDKKWPLSFSAPLRTSILRILNNYSDRAGEYDDYENITFVYASEALKTFYGKDSLDAFDDSGKRVTSDYSKLITNSYPSEVLDAVEALFDTSPKQLRECEKEINDLLEMHRSPWRFINGEALLIDSEYLHKEVQSRTLRLLQDGKAFGALEEFQEALRDLQSGENKDAVVKAHKSVESVMKTVLGIKEHIPFGGLLARLIQSDIIPKYYEDFIVHFEKLALGAVKERNRPGAGHGQGASATELPRSLAEFTVNLAGTINLFLLKRWVELTGKNEEKKPSNDEIPF